MMSKFYVYYHEYLGGGRGRTKTKEFADEPKARKFADKLNNNQKVSEIVLFQSDSPHNWGMNPTWIRRRVGTL